MGADNGKETLESIFWEMQNANITAEKTTAVNVRTALGPKGMNKMLADSMGDVIITGDRETILTYDGRKY